MVRERERREGKRVWRKSGDREEKEDGRRERRGKEGGRKKPRMREEEKEG